MKSIRWMIPLVATLATTSTCLAFDRQVTQNGSEVSLIKMMDGSYFPNSMPPSALTADFMAIKITGDGGSGGLMDMIMSPMMMIFGALGGAMGGNNDAAAGSEILGAIDTSWTKGEIANIAGQRFLVTYKLGIDLSDMTALQKNQDLSKTVLRLTYVRIESIKSLTPRSDITKEKFLKMLATKIPKKDTGGMVEVPKPR